MENLMPSASIETDFKHQQLVFTEPGRVELKPAAFSSSDLKERQVMLRNEVSLVSPGTEMACLEGTQDWAPLPWVPGYGAVGRVVATHPDEKRFEIGQRVFGIGKHAGYTNTGLVALAVPDGVEPSHAVFARLGIIAMTAPQVADAELGDFVAVLGLGLIGNLAAQLFRLAGCDVIGVDSTPRRRELALDCGITHAIEPGDDLPQRIRELTDGEMCRSVIDATGLSAVVADAPELCSELGDVVLLGTPRRAHETNLTDLLRKVHLWDHGCITLKGAHEGRVPFTDTRPHARHSKARNGQIALRLIADGRLKVANLITHQIKPNHAPDAYRGLAQNPDEYLGVLFDWTND